MTEPNTELSTLAQEINAYLAEGWSGPRDKDLLTKAASEMEGLTAELALFRERDALTRKALQVEGDGPLQFLALRVRQERDRAVIERDEVLSALDTLRWLHAEAVWHAEHHRAQVEGQGLSHALLLRGVPDLLAQVDSPEFQAALAIESSISQLQANSKFEQNLDDGRSNPSSPRCGAQEGMTGIRCDLAPGHQDQHSGRHATTHGPDDVTVNIQWDRASWDTCAPANPVWVAGNREPGGDVVQAVQGRMTGRIYRRETEHFGGAWWWGTERGQWVVWGRLLEDERVAEAVDAGLEANRG